MTTNTAELEAKEKQDKKDGFAKWMDQPATRMMLSMIPPGEKQEVLGTLLQETYSAGYSNGAGRATVSFVEAIFKNMDKNKDQRG